MVSKELAKQQEKVRAFRKAEELADNGLSVVDKELYERYQRKELALVFLLVAEVLILVGAAYYYGQFEAVKSCSDLLVATNGLTKEAALTACKTVVGL